MGRDVVIVFCKEPVVGRVKTRLAAGIGEEAACGIYRAMLRCCVSAAAGSGADETVLYAAPGSSEGWFAREFPGLRVERQEGADLGERMNAALTAELSNGADRAALIGSDIPALFPAEIQAAFKALERVPAAIGPCDDGGYYIVAQRRPVPEMFAGVEWSSPGVLEKTCGNLEAAGAPYELLEPLADLDEARDLAPVLKALTSLAARGADPDGSPWSELRELIERIAGRKENPPENGN